MTMLSNWSATLASTRGVGIMEGASEGASFMWWLSVLPPSQVLRWSQGEPRQVARTCRHFGISRTAFYHWKQRFDEHGEAGLADRPRATPRAVVSKILYLRQQYHFGPGRIADYLRRFHQVETVRTPKTLDRMLGRIGRQDVLDAVPGFIEGVTVVVDR